jgi:hypothetical protein
MCEAFYMINSSETIKFIVSTKIHNLQGNPAKQESARKSIK